MLADNGSPYPGFGDWAEQLIAESTGKDGKGILPVVVEGLDAPNYSPSTADEVLSTFGPSFDFDTVPTSGWGVFVNAPLGAQLLLWEYATAIAGRIIGINPFDQPDVESAKAAAREMLDDAGATPEPTFSDGDIDVYASGDWLPSGTSTVVDAVAALLAEPRRLARLRLGPGVPRPAPGRRTCRRTPQSRRTHRPPGHLRLGTAVPALDRSVPQGRAGDRRLPPGHRQPRRPTSRSPADRSPSTASSPRRRSVTARC